MYFNFLSFVAENVTCLFIVLWIVYFIIYFVVCIIAIVIGYLPAGFGVPSWVSLIAGVIVVFLGLRFIGEEVPFEEEAV